MPSHSGLGQPHDDGPGAAAPFGFLTDTFTFTVGLPGFVGPSNAGSAPGGFTYPLTAYFDAGYQPELVISGNLSSNDQFVSLTGYLESCAITGCHTPVTDSGPLEASVSPSPAEHVRSTWREPF